MSDLLEAAIDEFIAKPASLAEFDRERLIKDGEWSRQKGVSVRSMVGRFSQYEPLKGNKNTVILPLHERDSPELSGEYIEYRPDGLVETFVYYDTAQDKKARIDPDTISHTLPAWRLRYWTDNYDSDIEPSYVSDNTTKRLQAQSVAQMDSEEASAFFTELHDFIDTQREADRDETRDRYHTRSLSYVCREDGGIQELLLTGTVSTKDYSDVLQFEVPLDDEDNPRSINIPSDYGVYPGSEVLIGINESVSRIDEDDTEFPIQGEVVFVNDSTIGIFPTDTNRSHPSVKNELANDSTVFTVVQLLNTVPYDREADAVTTIKNDSRKRQILTGQQTLEFQPAFNIELNQDITLNEYQETAAERALRVRDVFCIHGPPGTGKTRTLRAIIKQAVEDDLTVLACAHSNQAVDNLLVGDSSLEDPDSDSLHAAALEDEIDIARAGTNSSNRVVNEYYATESPGQADVIGATTSMAAQFDSNSFDLAVVDEATQASIPATLIPYSVADRLILAGDHKQLPPYGSDELQRREIHVSLFEHLIERYDDNISTMLRTQYRMHDAIATYPNNAFYDGKLETADRNQAWTIEDLPAIEAYDVPHQESKTRGQSYSNEREARVAAKQVQHLLTAGVESHNIGIITPYSGQIGEIKKALGLLDSKTRSIDVDTVDSFQGGEREAIIVSFVRSNDGNRSGFLTFPEEGRRRLNVSLTRAKRRLVLLGDWATLGTIADHRNSDDSCADIFAELEQYLEDRNAIHRTTRPTG